MALSTGTLLAQALRPKFGLTTKIDMDLLQQAKKAVLHGDKLELIGGDVEVGAKELITLLIGDIVESIVDTA